MAKMESGQKQAQSPIQTIDDLEKLSQVGEVVDVSFKDVVSFKVTRFSRFDFRVLVQQGMKSARERVESKAVSIPDFKYDNPGAVSEYLDLCGLVEVAAASLVEWSLSEEITRDSVEHLFLASPDFVTNKIVDSSLQSSEGFRELVAAAKEPS